MGLFEFDGFTANDISAYECASGGATCTAAGVVTSAVPTINIGAARHGPDGCAGDGEREL